MLNYCDFLYKDLVISRPVIKKVTPILDNQIEIMI